MTFDLTQFSYEHTLIQNVIIIQFYFSRLIEQHKFLDKKIFASVEFLEKTEQLRKMIILSKHV